MAFPLARLPVSGMQILNIANLVVQISYTFHNTILIGVSVADFSLALLRPPFYCVYVSPRGEAALIAPLKSHLTLRCDALLLPLLLPPEVSEPPPEYTNSIRAALTAIL
jgi:hypothetical protein